MRIIRLTQEAFDDIAAQTRLGDHSREMAKSVLVDGLTLVEAANAHATSKQRVFYTVGVIERAYEKSSTAGVGSIRVELDLPEVLASELAALSAALKECGDAARCAEALEKTANAVRKATKLLKAAAPK